MVVLHVQPYSGMVPDSFARYAQHIPRLVWRDEMRLHPLYACTRKHAVYYCCNDFCAVKESRQIESSPLKELRGVDSSPVLKRLGVPEEDMDCEPQCNDSFNRSWIR